MGTINVHEKVYGQVGGRELRCDIYAGSEAAPAAPAVLLLHGGGWSAGDRGAMADFGERLAARGFVCVAPEYRLTGESGWPAQIEDVKAAIRWCHSQATKLGIDETKIAAMGFSAGAHLSLLAAGTPALEQFAGAGGSQDASDALAAVVAVYPPVLFYLGADRPSGATPAATLLGDAATSDAAGSASPLTYVGPGFPPVFLVHGNADKVVPPSASRVFYEALVRAGVAVELHMYAGQPHGFARQPEFVDLVAVESAHFLHRQLGTPEVAGVPQASATA